MIFGLIFVIYCVGFIYTARRVSQSWRAEFGVAKDFADFGTELFMAFCGGLLWPLLTPFYGYWKLRR